MPDRNSDAERSLARQRGQIGAHALHSQYDSRKLTEPARKKFHERWEQIVDPDGTLPEVERRRRAKHAKSLYYQQLAYRSAKARRSRRPGSAEATS